MHTGRTIDELIELVQHINTERGTYPGAVLDLIDSSATTSSISAPSPKERAEPAWLAVFL